MPTEVMTPQYMVDACCVAFESVSACVSTTLPIVKEKASLLPTNISNGDGSIDLLVDRSTKLF